MLMLKLTQIAVAVIVDNVWFVSVADNVWFVSVADVGNEGSNASIVSATSVMKSNRFVIDIFKSLIVVAEISLDIDVSKSK